MKVIDYLIKVANKEANNISIKTNDYFDEFFGNCRFQYVEDGLNSEIEIIEDTPEEKKIPEKWASKSITIVKNASSFDDITPFIATIMRTQNEIIDYLYYLKSKGDE